MGEREEHKGRPVHVERYGWEVHCTCGWTRRAKELAEAERILAEHIARAKGASG